MHVVLTLLLLTGIAKPGACRAISAVAPGDTGALGEAGVTGEGGGLGMYSLFGTNSAYRKHKSHTIINACRTALLLTGNYSNIYIAMYTSS